MHKHFSIDPSDAVRIAALQLSHRQLCNAADSLPADSLTGAILRRAAEDVAKQAEALWDSIPKA